MKILEAVVVVKSLVIDRLRKNLKAMKQNLDANAQSEEQRIVKELNILFRDKQYT